MTPTMPSFSWYLQRNMETMSGRALVACLLVLAAACGAEAPTAEPFRGPIARVLAQPEAFDGRVVQVRAWYVDRLGEQVLASGLAESYPPQPAPPGVWVSAPEPEGDCLTSDIGVTWGRVVATGVFRYEESGAFGPLGVLPMVLAGARLSCAD